MIRLEFVNVHPGDLWIIKPGVNQKNSVVREGGLYLIGAPPGKLKFARTDFGFFGILENRVAGLKYFCLFTAEEPLLSVLLDPLVRLVRLLPPFVL